MRLMWSNLEWVDIGIIVVAVVVVVTVAVIIIVIVTKPFRVIEW